MDIEVGSSGVSTGCGCGGCLSSLTGLAVMGLSVVMLVGGLAFIPLSHTGSDQAAVEAFEDCPAVTDALGSPLERVPYSMGCGEYEGGGGHAESSWTITVRGPKGSASGWYSASYTGSQPWVVHSATIDLPSGTVSAVPCASGSRPEPAPRRGRDRDRDDDERPRRGKQGKRR